MLPDMLCAIAMGAEAMIVVLVEHVRRTTMALLLRRPASQAGIRRRPTSSVRSSLLNHQESCSIVLWHNRTA